MFIHRRAVVLGFHRRIEISNLKSQFSNHLLLKRRIKPAVRGLEVDVLAELAGFAGAVFAVHTAVFPLDGERAGVTDTVESTDDFFEANRTAANAAEVPAATRIAERQVAAVDAAAAIQRR